MLDKQQIWLRQRKREFVAWFNKNKGAIGFGAGMAAMAGLYLLAERIEAPKEGNITFTQELTEDKPNVIAHVWYLNRAGKERNPLNIRYRDDGHLKALYDNLGTVVYPGD